MKFYFDFDQIAIKTVNLFCLELILSLKSAPAVAQTRVRQVRSGLLESYDCELFPCVIIVETEQRRMLRRKKQMAFERSPKSHIFMT